MSEQTGDGIVTQKVIALPGMETGEVGFAGLNRPGATIRAVAVPAWKYILVEILWVYLTSFMSILAMDGMGLTELAPASDAFAHLLAIGELSLGPSTLMLIKELYDYLGKVRASRL